MKEYILGVDVGGTKTAYGLFDREKNLVAERRSASDAGLSPEAFFDGVSACVKDIMAEHGIRNGQMLGVGLGMPSFIVFEKGYIVKTSNLTRIHDFPARSYLEKKLGGIPVMLDNDTHVAGLAEYRRGAGCGSGDMIYCAVSTGIASAAILGGRVLRGSYGWAGETGHQIVTPGEGIMCGCGNRGCFMSWCSGSMIVKHIQGWIASGEKTLMTELAGCAENIECRHLETAFDRNDALAARALGQMSKYLGLYLYNLYLTFNINCFVLGGGLVKMGEKLLGPARGVFDECNHNDMEVFFRTAGLTDRSGIIGAAELVFDNGLVQ
ncbi:MAG: ROK family protein [Treponema sp.]|nr:ROK family protein [Treponema sp.]